MLFALGDLTPLPIIQARVGLWLSENLPSEVLGLERPSKVLVVADLGTHEAGGEGKGDWDLSDLIGGLDLGHRASIPVDYGQL